MHFSAEKHPWEFTYGFNAQVDFCVWLLENNGFLVEPFDKHTPKKNELQIKGMTSDQWRKWFHTVVAQPQGLPYQLWDGDPTIGKFLEYQWNIYKHTGFNRGKWEYRLAMQWRQELPDIYYDLQPYRDFLPSLSIILVNYIEVIHVSILPQFIVLSIVNGELASHAFLAIVLDSIEELLNQAGLPRDRGARVNHTNISLPWQTILEGVPVEFRQDLQQRIQDVERKPKAVQEYFFQRTHMLIQIRNEGERKGHIKQIRTVGMQNIIIIDVDGIELHVPESELATTPEHVPTLGQEVTIAIAKFDTNGMRLKYTLS